MSDMFVVQGYSAGKRGAVSADTPIVARSVDHAREVARRLAVRKSLVVAFARKADLDTGEYEDARIIEAIGAHIPDEILEMPRI